MKDNREVTPSPSSWAATRYFLSYFLPVMVLFSGIAVVLYHKDASSERMIFENNEIHNVNLQMEIITSELESVASDLIWLASMAELQRMFAGIEANAARADLMHECLAMCQAKQFYDQVRVLDETGMELVRVNLNEGHPYIVPIKQLQSKAGRPYFKGTFLLGPGQIYVSPFDLNLEGGQIERPPKPVLRFGTPVFDNQGKKRGIVILNYLGARLLSDLDRSHADYPGEIMLLNSDGFWLHSPRPEDEWGFMFEDKRDRTFGKAFPAAWSRISTTESGQFHHRNGLFTFATVYPLLDTRNASRGSGKATVARVGPDEAKAYYWKIVSHVSPDVLNAGPHRFFFGLLQILIALCVLMGLGSGVLARARVNRRLAERELRESEEKFRALLQSASEAIVIVDSKGSIVLVNRRTEEMFGYRSDELLGQTLEILLPERFRSAHIKARADYVSSPHIRHLAADLGLLGLKKDGTEFPVEIGLSYVETHGEILSMSYITDITERKRVEGKVRQYQEQLRSLASELSLVEERERRRIAEELHDEIAQTLAVSKIRLAELRAKAGSNDLAMGLDEIQNHIDQTVAATRSLIFEISPPILYELGFEAAVEWLTEHFSEQHGLAISFKSDGKEKPLDEPIRIVLFKAVRELFVNVTKHAKASKAQVSIRANDQHLQVLVEDNGIGLDISSAESPTHMTSGFGLFNIRERLEHHGGKLEIESEPGHGTRVILKAPLRKER